MSKFRLSLAVAAGSLLIASGAAAAEPEVTLVIKNHRFEPAELKVKAGEKIKLIVHNQDATPEEFESHTLNREKVIPGGQTAVIKVAPLDPGRYEFFGEYHEDSAKGALVAK